MSAKVVIDRDEMERLVLMRMDLDRYEAHLIPDLYQENRALRDALRRLVEAVRGARQQLSLEAITSLRDAQRLLEERRDLSPNRPAVIE